MRTTTVVEHFGAYGKYFREDNKLLKGNTYKVYVLSFGGGFFEGMEDSYPVLSLKRDDSIFEISNFKSSYGFVYADDKIKLEGNKLNEEGFLINDYDNATILWSYEITLKKAIDEVEIGGKTYSVVCEDYKKDKSECKVNNEDKNNNSNKEENNKIENDNNPTDKVILDDIKFYILAGLLGTVVIEMFVLILKKTKKS